MTKTAVRRIRTVGMSAAAAAIVAVYSLAAEPAKPAAGRVEAPAAAAASAAPAAKVESPAAKAESPAGDSAAKEVAAPANGRAAMKLRQYYLWSEPAGIALIAYSAIGLALILERLLAWAAVRRASRRVNRQVQNLLANANRAEMLAAFQKSAAPLSRVMASVLENGVANSPETTQLLMENALDSMERRLKRNLALLACVAGTAPFLGLLGTVLGIMDTFNSIAREGLGSPAVISHGIGQALVTTAGGLAVAIPTFIAYNLFIAKANSQTGELREQASRIFVALGEM